MRTLTFLLIPLLWLGCTDSQPMATDHPVGPLFNVSEDHRAIVVSATEENWLFNGQGEIVLVECSEHAVFTQGPNDTFSYSTKCKTTNTTGRAVIFDQDNNPVGPGACGWFLHPSGDWCLFCNWREVISANGNLSYHAWGTPVYP